MKVIAGCSLDGKTVMKEFEFEDKTSEEEISDAVDVWAESIVHNWYVICKPEGEYKYVE